MKAAWAGCLAALVGLQSPDYAKLLKDANLSLAEAVERAKAEVKDGTPVSAAIELDEKTGKALYFVHVASGKATYEVSVRIDDGKVVEKNKENEDESKTVAAAKISLKQAIETALKKVEGKAVTADLDLLDDGTPEFLVEVFAGGKVTAVRIDGVKGEVVPGEGSQK